jgi:hypothetical protein
MCEDDRSTKLEMLDQVILLANDTANHPSVS